MSFKSNHYKDVKKWRKVRNRYKKKYYGRTVDARNRNLRWTLEDEEMVMNHEVTDNELAKKLGRSVAAIQQKRSKLNKGKYGYKLQLRLNDNQIDREWRSG